MKDLIVIAGAPGIGKTTISELLAKELNSFVLDFGRLREIHLDREWSNQSKEEEQMAFENLVFVLNNYQKHNYKNIILTDLQDFRVKQIPDVLNNFNFVIITLFSTDDEELRKRVTEPRDSGWKDAEGSVGWNKEVEERPVVKGEYKIDTTSQSPEETLRSVLEVIK